MSDRVGADEPSVAVRPVVAADLPRLDALLSGLDDRARYCGRLRMARPAPPVRARDVLPHVPSGTAFHERRDVTG